MTIEDALKLLWDSYYRSGLAARETYPLADLASKLYHNGKQIAYREAIDVVLGIKAKSGKEEDPKPTSGSKPTPCYDLENEDLVIVTGENNEWE